MELEDTILDYEENFIIAYAEQQNIGLHEAEKELHTKKRIFHVILGTTNGNAINYSNLEHMANQEIIETLANDIVDCFSENLPKRILLDIPNGGTKPHKEVVEDISPYLKKAINKGLVKFNEQHGSEFILNYISLKGETAIELRFNYRENSKDTSIIKKQEENYPT